MTRSRSLLLIALLFLFALPLAAQVNDTYVIPVVGNTAGANNTRWATRFSLFNPQAYPLTVSVTFLPSAGTTGTEKIVTVPANASVFSDNILESLYGFSGGGALLVATFPEDNPTVPNMAIDRSFLVSTNTYNNAKTGTFGQTIAGVWTGLQDYATDGISAIAHGVRNVSATGWRTNIGATNLGRSTVTLRMTIYDADGKVVQKNIPFPLLPMSQFQQALPVTIDRGSVEFFVDDPTKTAVVFPYASTIDQLSGDPTYQTPVLLATAGSLYGKGAAAKADLRTIGKSIDNTMTRQVRDAAVHAGAASIVRTGQGLMIRE